MFKNKLFKRRGQSTLEYIVLVTAIIVVLLIFLNPSSGKFSEYLNSTLDSAGQGMNAMSCRIFDK